jgi:hypothetical protein
VEVVIPEGDAVVLRGDQVHGFDTRIGAGSFDRVQEAGETCTGEPTRTAYIRYRRVTAQAAGVGEV